MQNLRIPGPTPCPDDVLKEMSHVMVNHRGPEFAAALTSATEKLKTIFQTKNDLFILTSSGTGGLEAAVVNILSPGDTVLGVSIGVFGDRFATIARTYGANVIDLKFEWGTAADPEAVRKALSENPEIKAVLVTHNETSTGVTNPLKEISKVVKEFDKLLLVDAVSSLGSINCPVDEWGIDVVVTGSQKGWMVPPGLAMVAISEKGWKANAEAKMPRFYWDFAKAKNYYEKGQTPWTPALSIIFALDLALSKLTEEGVEAIFAKHEKMGQKTRDGIKALGLSLFSDEKFASNTVTSIKATNGLDIKKLNTMMREEYGIVLGGGQQHLGGKIFRIGHLGYVNEADIDDVLEKLKICLPQAGFRS